MNNWTLFFWAWWVAGRRLWACSARISRGRTIRQFVMGTLIIPFTFTLLWLSVFGNSALYEIIHGDAAFARGDGPPGARLLQPAGAVSGVYL